MNNPFRYTGVVSGEAFCNRETELASEPMGVKP